VVDKQLMLRSRYKKRIGYKDFAVLAASQFSDVGRCHSHKSAPALIMNAVTCWQQQSDGRSGDCLNCADCATDLRLEVAMDDAIIVVT
jgi:hypothetical protein